MFAYDVRIPDLKVHVLFSTTFHFVMKLSFSVIKIIFLLGYILGNHIFWLHVYIECFKIYQDHFKTM